MIDHEKLIWKLATEKEEVTDEEAEEIERIVNKFNYENVNKN